MSAPPQPHHTNTGAPSLTVAAGASPESIAATFSADPRIHFSTVTGRWAFEDNDGSEWEYDAKGGAWIQVADDDLIRKQQAAYSVAGVDEEASCSCSPVTCLGLEFNAVVTQAPAAPMLKRLNKKRKEPEDYTSATTPQAGHSIKRGKNAKDNSAASSSAQQSQPRKSKNTAVYVTRLPSDTTREELAERFQRCGVLEEDDDGDPKIKLYAREDGSFSGEALVVYFKEESVALAVAMLDEAELRIGDPTTVMTVSQADFGHKGGESNGEVKEQRKTIDKKRATKRIGRMQKKLEDWDSDEELGPANDDNKAAGKNSRVVVLKHMFNPKQIEEDASLMLDLKEDVREECSALGEVTNVVLYDEEPEGIMTVKFKDPISAQACVLKMQGRFFDGRRIEAFLYTGKQRYKRSGAHDDFEGEGDATEKKRLDDFANWLMQEGE
ncbi:hypothetical protein ACEPAI_7674 [Sanghuangporus weigelae]